VIRHSAQREARAQIYLEAAKLEQEADTIQQGDGERRIEEALAEDEDEALRIRALRRQEEWRIRALRMAALRMRTAMLRMARSASPAPLRRRYTADDNDNDDNDGDDNDGP